MPARVRFVPLLGLLALGADGCVDRAAPPRAATSSAAPEGSPREPLVWSEYGKEAFARAKRENKLILLDGAAEWCHWCHVMEATSYHDPRVRQILDESFVTIKVDVDARPDLEERYGDWGWPATIILSPDAEELAKYKGYIAPDDFVRLLAAVRDSRDAKQAQGSRELPRPRLTADAFAYAARDTRARLASYWDDDQGGWGRMQKAPVGPNNAWLLALARGGDAQARADVTFSLRQQAKLIDPVWGGIYQYSAASDWDHPHFEKLATFQGPAMENYAEAYALTKDAFYMERALAIRAYVKEHLIAAFIESELAAPDARGLFEATRDPDASGVFAARRLPFEHEVVALRFFARLGAADPGWAQTHACFVTDVMSAVTTPEDLHAQGRWLGDWLLAESETRGVRSRCP